MTTISSDVLPAINQFTANVLDQVITLVYSPMGPIYLFLSIQIISLVFFLYFMHRRQLPKENFEKVQVVKEREKEKGGDIENQYLDSFRSSTTDEQQQPLIQTTARSPKYRNERILYPEAEFSDNEGLFE